MPQFGGALSILYGLEIVRENNFGEECRGGGGRSAGYDVSGIGMIDTVERENREQTRKGLRNRDRHVLYTTSYKNWWGWLLGACPPGLGTAAALSGGPNSEHKPFPLFAELK